MQIEKITNNTIEFTITLITNRFRIILEGGRYIKDQCICDFRGLQQFEVYKK